MSESMTDKIAIVTGASKGIGRAICIELAMHGYYTIINYKSDEAGARQTLEEVIAAGSKGEIMQFDVTDFDVTQAAIADIRNRFNTIDVLVNNAGITADGLFVMMSQKNWQSVVSTSLDGFYNVTKPVLEKMVRSKKGAIVSISSASGLMGNRGQANYSAAKAGIIGASRALSTEVARLGIRVNVVAPGLIETAMIKDAPVKEIKSLIPMARIGKPEEVAKLVRFLCSEDASYITGQVISINGGML